MSLLTKELPRQTPHGFQIVTDFRPWLEFECALSRPQPDADVFVRDALERAYPFHAPGAYGEQLAVLWADLLWFYRCGRAPQAGAAHKGAARQARAYDFEQDAPLILAAFRQAYSIDLTREPLHWWQFRALFEGLPADCRICKVMEYRTADTSDMPEKTRAFYQKMQERYRLQQPALQPRAVTVEEHNAAFIQRLTGH